MFGTHALWKLCSFQAEFAANKAFHEQLENQIHTYIDNFETYVERFRRERWPEEHWYSEGTSEELNLGDGKYHEEVEFVSGVTEEDYDLKALFTVQMPIHQRQAMLVTTYTLLENGLIEIFDARAQDINKTLKLKKNGTGLFEHLFNEAGRLGLQIKEQEGFSSLYKNIDGFRHVRNYFVHVNKAIKPGLKKYVKECELLEVKGGDLVVRDGYTKFVLRQIDDLIAALFKLHM